MVPALIHSEHQVLHKNAEHLNERNNPGTQTRIVSYSNAHCFKVLPASQVRVCPVFCVFKNVTNVLLGMHFMDLWLVMGLSQGIGGITGQTKHLSYFPDQDAHGDALYV